MFFADRKRTKNLVISMFLGINSGHRSAMENILSNITSINSYFSIIVSSKILLHLMK